MNIFNIHIKIITKSMFGDVVRFSLGLVEIKFLVMSTHARIYVPFGLTFTRCLTLLLSHNNFFPTSFFTKIAHRSLSLSLCNILFVSFHFTRCMLLRFLFALNEEKKDLYFRNDCKMGRRTHTHRPRMGRQLAR